MLETTLLSVAGLSIRLILIAGLLLGLGRLTLSTFVRRPLPVYWHLPLSAIAGVAIVNLAVQAVAFAGHATRFGLRVLTLALLLTAIISWVLLPPRFDTRLRASLRQCRPHDFLALLPLLAIAANFLIASAPSTKIDELYYHMLTPKRLMEDGALVSYLLPYEASALPHMQFQISLVLAHAWRWPDLGNVASALFGILLAGFLYGFCMGETRSRPVSIMLASGACVGLYTAVHHTTSGPHALGDLAIVLACVALLETEQLAAWAGGWQSMALVALSAAMGAATKISLWPLALGVTVLYAIRLCRTRDSARRHAAVALAAVLPWIVCQGPMLTFSWLRTGAPFGPFFFGSIFGAGPPAEFAEVTRSARIVNQMGLLQALVDFAMSVSPVLLISIFSLAWPRGRAQRARLLLVALVLLETALIALWLPHNFRFLSGLMFAAVAAAAVALADSPALEWLESHCGALSLVLLGPWLAVQLYYAAPFARVFMGLTGRPAFIERYVALTADYRALDKLLPRQAVLLTEARIPAVYAPRPVVFTWRDLRGRQPVYFLAVEEAGSTGGAQRQPLEAGPLLECATEIYRNPNATVTTFRNPLEQPVRGFVGVYACRPAGAAPGAGPGSLRRARGQADAGGAGLGADGDADFRIGIEFVGQD